MNNHILIRKFHAPRSPQQLYIISHIHFLVGLQLLKDVFENISRRWIVICSNVDSFNFR